MRDFQFSPSLPWSEGYGGTITILSGPVTEEQLLLGRVRFNVENDGTPVTTEVKRGTDGELYLYAGNNILYRLSLQQGGTIIDVTSRGLGSLSITGAELVLAPVAGSIAAHLIEQSGVSDVILVCTMTDGSKRALTQGGQLIIGVQGDSDPAFAYFAFSPSPLVSTSPVPPSPVDFKFLDVIPVPAAFELQAIEASYEYKDYDWDESTGGVFFRIVIVAETVSVTKADSIVTEDEEFGLNIDNYTPGLTL